jgi:hypothetical protein
MFGVRFPLGFLSRNRRRKTTLTRKPAQTWLALEALEDRTVPSFAAPVALGLPAASQAVATGHFEGAKAPLDVVTANANGTVSVLLGKGDGTLVTPINLHVGGSLTSVAVADLLGNGLNDIVTGDSNGTVHLLLSNGNGTFKTATTFTVGASPKGVALGDFLGHGKLDIVTANRNGTVTVLPGNGDGTFGAPITSSVDTFLTSVAVGEFNGDGKPDLVVGTGTGLDVLLGNGDGTFQVKSRIPFEVEPSMPGITVAVTSVAVADLRGEGKEDIVANGSGNLAVLLGNGDGTFGSGANLGIVHLGGFSGVASFVVGDFTGDGKPDIVTSDFPPSSTTGPTLSVLAGNGDGTFQIARSQNFGSQANALAAGDFLGNGKLDLAFAAGNSVTALLGNGDGTFVTAPSVSVATVLPSAIATGHFTGSGKPDLVTTGIGGDAVVLLNNGDGTFRTGPTLSVPDSPDAVVAGDFTGNGHQDVAVATEGGLIDVFLGNGDGTFAASPLVVDLGINHSIEALVAGDFNHDGHLDLAAASLQTGQVTILLGNGDGTFKQSSVINVGGEPGDLVAADLAGNGRLDLVVTDRLGTVTVLLNNGNGTFRTTTPIQVSEDVFAVSVGDFFGDGKEDLAVTNLGHQGASSSISVLRGNGDGTFQTQISLQLGNVLPSAVVAGDFFGDVKLGLAVSHADTVSVFRGNGDGTFQAPLDLIIDSAASEPNSLVTGDFNGDGKLDLAATNFLTNEVSVLLNTSALPSTAAPAATATSLAVDTPNTVFGQPVTLTATVSLAGGTTKGGPPMGTITFLDGATVLGEVPVDPNGQASFVVPLRVGNHSLTASFAGIAPFTASTSTAVAETVTRAATTTTLAVDELSGPSVVDFTATVVAVPPGAGVPTGTVTFLDGSRVLGTSPVDANGQAGLFLMTGLPPGTNSLTASYGGDGNFRPSASAATVITVSTPAATTTALTASTSSSVFGQPVTLTATVTSSAGTPTGSVTFFEDGAFAGTAFLSANGVATFTVAPGVGTHTLTAAFTGNSTFAASSADVTEIVSQASTTTTLTASVNPVAAGQSVVFTASVAAVAPGSGTPTGTVTFKDGNVVLGTVTLDANARATLSTRFSTAGSHTITAVYTGDDDFAGSSRALTEQVKAAPSRNTTTTALVSSANPGRVGQTITFTATVSGPAGTTSPPTGTITFFVGNKAVATVTLDATGKARLTRRFLVAGKFTIRAVYNGDSTFAASSQSLVEQVN